MTTDTSTKGGLTKDQKKQRRIKIFNTLIDLKSNFPSFEKDCTNGKFDLTTKSGRWELFKVVNKETVSTLPKGVVDDIQPTG